jgi:hypothetical protein
MHETHIPGALPKQLSFAQSVFCLQCFWSAHFGHAGPPQSTSVSISFWTPSVQVGAWHVPPLHTPSTQSAFTLQMRPSAHAAHVPPPQSVSVSLPSLTPSMHDDGTHLPLPSQALPPWSLHTVPLTASFAPQAFAVHVAVTHVVPRDGQSPGALQPTQWPLASQTEPPSSAHEAPTAAFFAPHTFPRQVAIKHLVMSAGQSVAVRHATQLPLPSQTAPPPAMHAVP